MDANIGFIKDIFVYQKGIRIDYKLTGQEIKFYDLMQLTDILDMGTWEWNRTHWTLKNANLDDIKPYFKKGKTVNNPTVFPFLKLGFVI